MCNGKEKNLPRWGSAGNVPGFAGREGAAAAAHGDRAPAGAHGRCTPHFLFETSKRKCAVHGGKEKMFGRKAGATAAFLRKMFGRRGRCGVDLQARTGCAIPLGNREVLRRICRHGCIFRRLPERKADIGLRPRPPRPISPHCGDAPAPFLRGGKSKGEGP